MRRRTLLAGLATVAAGIGGTGAMASSLSGNDALLLSLATALTAAKRADDAAYEPFGGMVSTDPGYIEAARIHAAAEAARRRAFEALSSVPADGWAGVAIKGAVLAACLSEDNAAASWEMDLADSLRADLARLVPGLEVEA